MIGITNLNDITIYPESVQFKQEKVCTYDRYLYNTVMLKEFLKQLKGYFDLIDPYLHSLTTLNHLLNHNDDYNFKNDYFGYKKAPKYQLILLALARLVNDPDYIALYEQWSCNVIEAKGESIREVLENKKNFYLQSNLSKIYKG